MSDQLTSKDLVDAAAGLQRIAVAFQHAGAMAKVLGRWQSIEQATAEAEQRHAALQASVQSRIDEGSAVAAQWAEKIRVLEVQHNDRMAQLQSAEHDLRARITHLEGQAAQAQEKLTTAQAGLDALRRRAAAIGGL